MHADFDDELSPENEVIFDEVEPLEAEGAEQEQDDKVELPPVSIRNLSELKAELKEIPIHRINRTGRRREDYGDMASLKTSIIKNGLIMPIAVMEYTDAAKDVTGFDYYLLAGGRRTMAMEQLEKETILARVYPASSKLNGYESSLIEFEENYRRKDITEAERIKSLAAIHNLYESLYGKKSSPGPGAKGHSLRDTAKMLDISVGKASEDVELAKWMDAVPELKHLATRSDIKKAIAEAKKKVQVAQQVKEVKDEIAASKGSELEVFEKSYIVGDFFELVKKVPDETIDFIDCDIDYPIEEETPNNSITKDREVEFGNYFRVNREAYPKLMQTTLKECFRVMKPNSWIVVWFGQEYFKEIQLWGQEAGFKTTFHTGKWVKGSAHAFTSAPSYNLRHSMEPFFYFRKGNAVIKNVHTDSFDFPPYPIGQRVHPHEKPLELMEELIKTFTLPGSSILVPFCGSGKTLIAGFNFQCRAIGFDLSADYKAKYVASLKKHLK